ncbi:hypothetical protein SEVCU071_2197 [Staphylococcus epidermidis VCU071]|jgi:replication protein|nr:hypothetical protein SEVCU071_2197 [Staphylococcus epidermidis VCU071]
MNILNSHIQIIKISNLINNDALKFQLLEELTDQIKSYLSNFEVKDVRIIKSVLIKG